MGGKIGIMCVSLITACIDVEKVNHMLEIDHKPCLLDGNPILYLFVTHNFWLG